MMLRQSSCVLLLAITVGFAQEQRDGARFSEQDGFAFPGESDRPAKFPLPTPPPQNPNIKTPVNPGSGARSENDINQCIDQCPVTSEYNPICGSDNQVYSNPGRLNCARNCGKAVDFVMFGQCIQSGRG